MVGVVNVFNVVLIKCGVMSRWPLNYGPRVLVLLESVDIVHVATVGFITFIVV